jgi:hypothetical protein
MKTKLVEIDRIPKALPTNKYHVFSGSGVLVLQKIKV